MSKYGGKSAAAGVAGFKSGYSFIDQAQSASQEARAKEERIKKAVTGNKLLDIAYEDAVGTDPQADEVAQLKQQVAELSKTTKASNSNSMKQDINESALPTNGRDRSKMVETLKTRFKTNPDIYKALGIQNAQTMSILNPRDQKDRTWMIDTLEQQGVSPETQGVDSTSPEWASIVDDAIDGYPAMKADGSIVDLVGLSVATGASSMANPEYNARMEQNMEELRARVTRSGNNMEKALSTEAGDPMPPLETVEQKEMVRPTTGAEIGMDGQKMDNTGVEQLAETLLPDNKAVDIPRLKTKEGFRGEAYQDQEGHWTIGYGHKILPEEQHLRDGSLSEEEATKLLNKDATEHADKFSKAEPWVADLDPNAQKALNDMAYNMGPNWMDKFPSVRKALQEGDFEEASKIIKGSKYAKQVGKRADENASMIAGVPVSLEITKQVSAQGGTEPLNDMRMRKVYALLGKSYPKDPNEPTAKMKNYEYLSDTVGADKAFEAVFGDKNNKKLSRLGKTIRDAKDALARGDQESHDILMKGAKKMADKRTSSQYGADTAREDNRDLLAKGKDNWTDEDKDNFEANKEIIQSFEKPVGIETIEEKLKMQQEAHQVSNKYAGDIDKAITAGTRLAPEAEGDLKYSQQLARQSAPNKTVESDGKLVEKMQANQLGANEIASVLNRFESGDLQNVEKGVVDNALQYVETKMPSGFKLDADRKETIDANIKAGTALGFLQATLIKAMSGTAASDAEVQRLTDVMQGNNWNQPEYLQTALKEFYDVLERQQGTFKSQLRVSPYEGYSLSVLDKVGGKTEPESVTADIGKKKVVKRGTLADGTKVVQYEDGTQGVE